MTCRYVHHAEAHLTREHQHDCTDIACLGCQPCQTDGAGNPVRHCRIRRRCASHLEWGEHACPGCLNKIRGNLTAIVDQLALMPDEAEHQGIDSEPANLAGPHADFVTAGWRLTNQGVPWEAIRNDHGEIVVKGILETLDMRDPYTCLTMHERLIREDLGHDQTTLVSPTIAACASYLDWVLTDLARDEGHAHHVVELLADTARLRGHVEAVLRDSRAPERGIPCPECVRAERDAPRLVRHYGHWCTQPGCDRLHYLDTSGDRWTCPACQAAWTHADYEARLVERKHGRIGA